MRKIFLVVLLSLWAIISYAQEEVDYMRYKIGQDDKVALRPVEDDTLHLPRITPRYYDTFSSLTDYSFSFVGYARRGLDYTEQITTLDGIDLRSSVVSILRNLGADERQFGGLAHGEQRVGHIGGSCEMTVLESVPLSSATVGVFLSGKGSLGGVRAAAHNYIGSGWTLSTFLAARGGNDLYIKGVYNDAIDAGVRLTRNFQSGAMLSVLCAARIGARGLRTGSTEEAFSLLDNNLYNPLWGRQQGKVRNSRVRRDAVPFLMGAYADTLSRTTSYSVALGVEYGLNSLSSLSWYDAMTPRPDNYRYMPSYFADEDVAMAVAERWRAGDERYTQINWEDIYRANRQASGGAVYTLGDERERLARGQMAIRFVSRLSSKVTLTYGLRGEIKSSRRYRQLRDMLGSDYLVDLDYYLLDDDTYSNNMQNNLRHPNRKVGRRERYAYDYALRERSVMARIGFEYSAKNWRINADAEVGSAAISRRGFYEKELFAGNKSFGRSAVARFTPYTLKFSADYSFSSHHLLRVAAVVGERVPFAENLFLNPQYNNRLTDVISAERFVGVEADYRYSSQGITATVTAYMNSVSGRSRVFRSYDDLSGLYCDVVTEDIGTMAYGVEATAVVPLSRGLRASFVGAAGRYIYSHNPFVTLYSDTDNSIVSHRSEALMGDCFVGGTPQVLARAALNYFYGKGWAASCSVQYAGLRYVDASFVRRSERVLRQATSSHEIYEQFVHQRRLRDAVTLDVSVSRWFRLGSGRMSLTLAVKNLLGNKSIVQYGYEPSRLLNHISGSQRIYKPHAEVVTYAYPRNVYAVVSWKF